MFIFPYPTRFRVFCQEALRLYFWGAPGSTAAFDALPLNATVTSLSALTFLLLTTTPSPKMLCRTRSPAFKSNDGKPDGFSLAPAVAGKVHRPAPGSRHTPRR